LKNYAAEIITIGNEILSGYTINTNASFISQEMLKIGLPVQWVTTISDTADEILFALEKADQRADVTLVTGGLGPTPDDITKNTICNFFDTGLTEDKNVLNHVRNLLKHRGLDMLESNIAQAMVPETATIIPNPIGTAPGLFMRKNEHYFFFMPGVPSEMKRLITEHIIVHIKEGLDLPEVRNHLIRTTGIAESRLYELLRESIEENPDIPIAFLPRHIGVDLRFRLISDDANQIDRYVKFISKVRSLAGKFIFTEQDIELEERLGQLLTEKKLSLSIAESFTGGMISDLITNIPGSSAYLLGSAVTYSNESKMKTLGVLSKTLEQFGAVSEETVTEMVRGIQKYFKADCAISTTGIAGPTGATETKPVGLCYIAARYGEKETVRDFNFGTDRIINKRRGATAALEMLRRLLLDIH
jgi:nicotinamide-nucleotide amidase